MVIGCPIQRRAHKREKHQEAVDTKLFSKTIHQCEEITTHKVRLKYQKRNSIHTQHTQWTSIVYFASPLLAYCVSFVDFIFYKFLFCRFLCHSSRAYVLNFNFSRLSFAHRRNYSMWLFVCVFAKCSIYFVSEPAQTKRNRRATTIFFTSSTGFSYTK